VTRPLALIGCAALLLAGCAGSAGEPELQAGMVACSYIGFGQPARPVEAPPAAASTVGVASLTLTMTGGSVTITGDRSRTPCTLHSIESLAKQGFFDDTGCHRLADFGMFMVQCGDPTGTGRGTPGYRFADELDGGASYPAGTVAMANAGPDSNGSQFFIIYADSPLPPNYTVFGTIDEASLKVIRTMAADGQDNGYGDGTGRPRNPFRILKATVG
jgi:peptidyl-prolyl cis-trans isomerase B (cyclophilin B)